MRSAPAGVLTVHLCEVFEGLVVYNRLLFSDVFGGKALFFAGDINYI